MHGNVALLILREKFVIAHSLLRGVLIHDDKLIVLLQQKISAKDLPDDAVHFLRLWQLLLKFFLLLTELHKVIFYGTLDLAFLTENHFTVVFER